MDWIMFFAGALFVGLPIGFLVGGETRWWIVWRQSDRQTWLDWQNIAHRWRKLYEMERARTK